MGTHTHLPHTQHKGKRAPRDVIRELTGVISFKVDKEKSEENTREETI